MALGQGRNQNPKVSGEGSSGSNDFQATLSETCLTLNAKFHTCIDRLVKEDVANPHKIEDIDIERFLNKLDPDIWKAMCLLTQPLYSQAVRELKIQIFVE